MTSQATTQEGCIPDISSENKRGKLKTRKKQAKIGLAVSIGVLVATGFGGSKTAKSLHIAAGAALVGLSVWHHSLYRTKPRKDS